MLLALLASPASAERDRDSIAMKAFIDRDVFDELVSQSLLFYGTLDSAHVVDYKPTGECGEGLSPLRVHEWNVSADDVLIGALTEKRVPIRFIGPMSPVIRALRPGTRVLAWGTRICPDNWRVWGGALAVSESNEFRTIYALGEMIGRWEQKHARAPSTIDLQARMYLQRDRLPPSPFSNVRTLTLVRVNSRAAPGPDDPATFDCSVVRRLYGESKRDSFTVAFDSPLGSACSGYFQVGDTLLIPERGGSSGGPLTIKSCPDYCIVESGYLPGIGVEVERVLGRFEATRAGLRLKQGLLAE